MLLSHLPPPGPPGPTHLSSGLKITHLNFAVRSPGKDSPFARASVMLFIQAYPGQVHQSYASLLCERLFHGAQLFDRKLITSLCTLYFLSHLFWVCLRLAVQNIPSAQGHSRMLLASQYTGGWLQILLISVYSRLSSVVLSWQASVINVEVVG